MNPGVVSEQHAPTLSGARSTRDYADLETTVDVLRPGRRVLRTRRPVSEPRLRTQRSPLRWVIPGFAFLAAVACASQANASENHPSITDGETAGICDFPSVVAFSAYDEDGSLQGGCTAALVAPRMILTAGHCVDNDAFDTVEFASDLEDARAESLSIKVERCVPHPDFSLRLAESDIGYCILEDDAPGVPIIPPLMGCEAEILSPGRTIISVGFGRTESASAGGDGGRGVKRWGEQAIQPVEFLTNNFVTIASPSSACNGDSGGPGLVQFPDGSWRIAGIASTVHPNSGLECGLGNVYEVLHTLVPWVEEDSGVDITPCHDADGTWNPTEACGNFPLDLLDSDAQWDALCQTRTVSPLSGTCGLPWEDPSPETSSSSGGLDETTGGDEGPESTTTGGPASSDGSSGVGTGEDSGSGGPSSQDAADQGGCAAGGHSGSSLFGAFALIGFAGRRWRNAPV